MTITWSTDIQLTPYPSSCDALQLLKKLKAHLQMPARTIQSALVSLLRLRLRALAPQIWMRSRLHLLPKKKSDKRLSHEQLQRPVRHIGFWTSLLHPRPLSSLWYWRQIRWMQTTIPTPVVGVHMAISSAKSERSVFNILHLIFYTHFPLA